MMWHGAQSKEIRGETSEMGDRGKGDRRQTPEVGDQRSEVSELKAEFCK
jgi:hypothetical protein